MSMQLLSTVRKISIRTKNFILLKNFGKLFQNKNKFLMKTFMIILKANLIKISDNKKNLC